MHTNNLRKLALETNDGGLRGPAFGAADEIDRLRAEVERLNNALTEAANQIGDLATRLGQAEGRLDASELVGVIEGWKARAETAEAERDEARAQVAAAYEAAAIRSENYACGAPYNQRASINALANSLRGMTPDDAKAALEAYGREKVREGMQRAANIAEQCWESGYRYQTKEMILADIEKSQT